MSDSSIYQPPLPQPPPYLAVPQVKPAVVTVFGILHLVFAAIGILAAAWGLFVALVGNPFIKMAGETPGLEAQIAMQEKLEPMTLISSILSLLVAIPMVIAGIQMLRDRKNGLKWSNRYAISSLVTKVVNIVLTVTVMLPAIRAMTESMAGAAGMPASTRNLMSGSMVGGAIGGAIVSCAYPVLSLILLNRPFPKAWFASLIK